MEQPGHPVLIDVEAENIARYERVFSKCLDAAQRVAQQKFTGITAVATQELALEIATAMFKRFYADQSAIQGAERQARSMITALTSIMEGRGGAA